MSELKATTAQEIVRNEKDCDYMDELFGGVKMPPIQVYLKSEADKVIAEKDKVITYARRLVREDIELISHQKYKRCLDNAWWCRKLSNAYTWDVCTHRGWKIAGYYDKKAELYRKWRKRWLELAEHFKPNKEA